MVLGEPIRGEHIWELGVAPGAMIRIFTPLPFHARRAALLAVEQVPHDRLLWLIMRGQRSIMQTVRRIEPRFAVSLHDERVDAGNCGQARGVFRRTVGWRTIADEVGLIESGPMVLLFIPPDVFLTFRPWAAFGVG